MPSTDSSQTARLLALLGRTRPGVLDVDPPQGSWPSGLDRLDAVEDWCGTPWPRRWPWPGPGPHPLDGPQPDPWVVGAARAQGALVLASLAAGLGDGELRDVLARGAEQLADAAVHAG